MSLVGQVSLCTLNSPPSKFPLAFQEQGSALLSSNQSQKS